MSARFARAWLFASVVAMSGSVAACMDEEPDEEFLENGDAFELSGRADERAVAAIKAQISKDEQTLARWGRRPLPGDRDSETYNRTSRRVKVLTEVLRSGKGKPLFFSPATSPLERGAIGRLGLVYGDLARARNIAVLVPDAETRLDTFTVFGGQAENLYLAANRDQERRSTAVIAWLGYDPPQGRDEVQPKGDGGSLLFGFLGTLRAKRPDARIGVVSLGYGGVVTADFLKRNDGGNRVDRVVYLGSPGLGFDVPDTNFGIDATFQATAYDDPGTYRVYGTYPARMRSLRHLCARRQGPPAPGVPPSGEDRGGDAYLAWTQDFQDPKKSLLFDVAAALTSDRYEKIGHKVGPGKYSGVFCGGDFFDIDYYDKGEFADTYPGRRSERAAQCVRAELRGLERWQPAWARNHSFAQRRYAKWLALTCVGGPTGIVSGLREVLDTTRLSGPFERASSEFFEQDRRDNHRLPVGLSATRAMAYATLLTERSACATWDVKPVWQHMTTKSLPPSPVSAGWSPFESVLNTNLVFVRNVSAIGWFCREEGLQISRAFAKEWVDTNMNLDHYESFRIAVAAKPEFTLRWLAEQAEASAELCRRAATLRSARYSRQALVATIAQEARVTNEVASARLAVRCGWSSETASSQERLGGSEAHWREIARDMTTAGAAEMTSLRAVIRRIVDRRMRNFDGGEKTLCLQDERFC
ncbi:MAG: hypothetical protein KF782_24860 [Labilithrix sp.]|nr:hypothetical protein [Labilithrix sp.]